MIEISKEDYRRIAALVRERIGTAEWFNGTVAVPPPAAVTHTPPATCMTCDPAPGDVSRKDAACESAECGELCRADEAVEELFRADAERGYAAEEWRLVLTAIVYRRREELPEGPRHPIADVVPVWWEFSTGTNLNDFSFAELLPYLLDYE